MAYISESVPWPVILHWNRPMSEPSGGLTGHERCDQVGFPTIEVTRKDLLPWVESWLRNLNFLHAAELTGILNMLLLQKASGYHHLT